MPSQQSDCQRQLLMPEARVYEAIPKHDNFNSRTNRTFMDLSVAAATAILKTAIADQKQKGSKETPTLWAYKADTEKVYRFMCNNCSPAAWHGYPTDECPPSDVLRQWRDSKLITNAQYKKFLTRNQRA